MYSSVTKRVEIALVIGLIGLAVLLRLPARSLWTYDLKPFPDAVEYAMLAERIAGGSPWTLSITGQELPARYPPATSVLMAPVFWFASEGFSRAYIPILIISVASVLLLYLLARSFAGVLGASIATLFFIVSPAHVGMSVLGLSEGPSVFLLLAAAWMSVKALREGRSSVEHRGTLFLTGLLASVTILARYPNALFPLSLIIGALTLRRVSRRACVWLGLGSLAGLGILFLYHTLAFGVFFLNGYRYWSPEYHESVGQSLSPRFLWDAPEPGLMHEGNALFYLAVFSGLDPSLVTPVVILLALIGSFYFAREERALFCAWSCFVLGTAILYGCYYFRGPRFVLTTLPFLCVFCAVAVDRLLRSVALGARSWMVRRCVGAAFVGLSILLSVGVVTLREGQGQALLHLYDHFVGAPEGAITPHLPRAFSKIPHDAIVIIDFPRVIAESAAQPGQTLVNLLADGGDRHVYMAWTHDLVDLDGVPFRPPVLMRLDQALDPDVVATIENGFESNRGAFFILSPASGNSFKNQVQEKLRPRFGFKRHYADDVLWIIELVPR